MSFETQLAAIDRQITNEKATLKLSKALDRLKANPDFITIIKDGYLRDEAVRLVHLKADPVMQSVDKQTAVIRDIDAIGALASYFHTISKQGDMAEAAIEAAQVSREEILEEQANG